MTTPVASVIVPTLGGAERLPVLFRALVAQNHRDFEIVPVLDGDIDGSAGVVETWATATELRINPVVFSENQGRAAALNAGMAAAQGEILIRCDDDLEPGVDYIGHHVRYHATAAQPIGVVGPCANVLPDNAYARVYGRQASERALQDLLAVGPDRAWRHWAGNVSLTAETAAVIGTYDHRYRRYGWEDADYGYRLHRAGIPVVIAPELTVDHHMAATSTTVRALRALHSGAARETFVRIHGEQALRSGESHRNAWQTIVEIAAKLITEQSLRVLGAGTDAVIPRLPRPIGQKLVALLVESAGVAGVEYPHRARTVF